MSKKKRPTLGLAMIVKDEEEVVERSLSSVKEIVDEMIVVDTGSTDKTRAIAEGIGAKVIQFEWVDDFAAARNAGIEEITSDWILILDADEEFAGGASTLPDLLRDKHAWAYYATIANAPSAGEIDAAKEGYPSIRLFRNREELRYKYPIHEQIMIDDVSRSPLSQLVICHFGPSMGRNASKKASRNIPILEAALEDDSEDAYFHAMLGNEYIFQEKFADALGCYSDALKRVGHTASWSPAIYRNAIWSMYNLGDVDQAMQLLEECEGHYPDYTDLIYVAGLIASGTGNGAEADRLFQQCLEMGDPPPHYVTFGGTGSWRAEAALSQARGGPPD